MKKSLMYIFLFVLILIVISIFYINYTSKKNVIARIFDKIATSDYRYFYDKLPLSDSDFTTKEYFEQQLIDLNISDNYTIKDIKFDSRLVTISYLEAGNNKIKEYSFIIQKSNEFFDKWQISLDTFVVENYELIIPKAYTVYLDGINLSPYYINEKIYRIPKILVGTHELKLINESATTNVSLEIDNTTTKYEYIETGSNELINISYDDFLDLYNSQSKSVIIIGSSSCFHCIKFKPVMEMSSYKYNVPIHFLDINLLTKEQYANFKKIEYINNNFVGTPFTILVQNAIVLDQISGYTLNVDSFFKSI